MAPKTTETGTVIMSRDTFNKLIALIPESVKKAHRDSGSVPEVYMLDASLDDISRLDCGEAS